MAHATRLTKFEKRTVVLLTIMGIMGSLLGIIAIAIPYFLANTLTLALCDQCTDMKAFDAQLIRTHYTTAAIIILSIVVGFLPRFIYGLRLRTVRRVRARSEQENTAD